MRAPTIKDVARVCGVSYATVSLSLRDPSRVKASTRERIQAAIEKVGYQPNRAASLMAASRHVKRGDSAFLPIAYASAIPDHLPHVRDQRGREAMVRARELGYDYRRVNLYNKSARDLARVSRELYHQGVAGIVIGNLATDQELDAFDWSKFSVVGRGSSAFHRRFNNVRVAVFEPLCQLFERAWNRGYRKILTVVLKHEPEIVDDVRRMAAAEYCMKRFSGEHRWLSIKEMGRGIEWVQDGRFDLVLAPNSSVVFRLREAGLRVPEDIAVATYLGSGPKAAPVINAHMDPRQELVTQLAVELLDQQIRYSRRGFPDVPQSTVVSSRFVDGPCFPDKNGGGSIEG